MTDQLTELLKRIEAISGRSTEFKERILERKMSSMFADVVEGLTLAEKKVQSFVEVAAPFCIANVDDVSIEALMVAKEKSTAVEKDVLPACEEAKRLILAKQGQATPRGEIATFVTKLTARINATLSDHAKHAKGMLMAEQLIEFKRNIETQTALFNSAEEKVDKVETVASSLGIDDGTELSDDDASLMGAAVVDAQAVLKSSLKSVQELTVSATLPSMKASLQHLVDRNKRCQAKLEKLFGKSKSQRERVLSVAYVTAARAKVREVDASLDKVGEAELPFLKGFESIPTKEASASVSASEVASAAVQRAIGEARDFIALKNIEIRRFQENVSKPAMADLGKLTLQVTAAVGKLSTFNKETAQRKKVAQDQEAALAIDGLELVIRQLAADAEPLSGVEGKKLPDDEACVLSAKLTSQGQEVSAKIEETRTILATRMRDFRDPKASTDQADALKKLQDRLVTATSSLSKTRKTIGESESRFATQRLVKEAQDLMESMDAQIKSATEACEPLIQQGGEEFLVAASVEQLAAVLRQFMIAKDISEQDLFRKIGGGGADAHIHLDAFLTFLETLPEESGRDEATFTLERRKSLFTNIDADGDGQISNVEFTQMFKRRYVCVQKVTLTDVFEVVTSKTIGNVSPSEALEVLSEAKIDEATGVTRMECKLPSSGQTGFVTALDSAGSKYIEPVDPYKAFILKVTTTIEETQKMLAKKNDWIKTQQAEIATPGKYGTEARTEISKLRPKVATAHTSVDMLRKKWAAAQVDYTKRLQADKDAHVEVRDKKLVAIVIRDVAAKVEALEANITRLEVAAAPLLSSTGASLDAFATPCSLLEDAETILAVVSDGILSLRAFLKEQKAKAQKGKGKSFTELRIDLQKAEFKVAAVDKTGKDKLTALRQACQTIVDARVGQASTALRDELKRRGITNEEFFKQLAEPGEDRISEGVFCTQLSRLEGFSFLQEHLQLLFRHLEPGGIGRRTFFSLLQQYFMCVKAIAVTDCFELSKAKILRGLELEEVLEVLEGPNTDEAAGLTRVRGKLLTDGLEGWISVKGNQGTPFLQKGQKPFYVCVADVPLDKEFAAGIEPVRILSEDEVLEVLEGPRRQTYSPGLRVRGKSTKDGSTGWFTVKDKTGTDLAEVDSKNWMCTASVAMTDNEDISNCKVLKKCEKGEQFTLLEGPVDDAATGVTRVKGRSLKDDKVGWITIKGNAGTSYAGPSTKKHYTVLKDVAMQKRFPSAGNELMRVLVEGESVEALEGPKEETFPSDVRMKGRALKDGAVGWIVKSKNVKPWSAYYKCLQAVPIHAALNSNGDAEIVCQLAIGDKVEMVEGPVEEGGEKRIKVRVLKDSIMGWVTIKNKEGRQILESCVQVK